MFEWLFEKDAEGAIKGLTLEWRCCGCDGLNFRILSKGERRAGEYHTHCRYCRWRFRVIFPPQDEPVVGETEFMGRLDEEDFSEEVKTDLIRDFAEIAALRADHAPAGAVKEKEKALQMKIDSAKRRRH